jgi:hypothetical protein
MSKVIIRLNRIFEEIKGQHFEQCQYAFYGQRGLAKYSKVQPSFLS